MPVLTPQLFHAVTADVWAKAQADFAKDGYVYGHLIGISREVTMCSLAQAGTDEERARLAASGMTALPPGPWRESADLIADTLRRNNSVALIWVGEAWTVSDLPSAVDVLSGGARPAEQPLRDEMVYTYATWPRARLTQSHFARIDRGKRVGDTPTLEPFRDDHPLNEPVGAQGSTAAASGVQLFMFGWLDALLPQPPAKKS